MSLRISALAFGLVAAGGVIFIAFSDDFRLPPMFDGPDKQMHAFAFCVLGFLLSVGARAEAFWTGVIVMGLAAFAIEGLQPIVTATREASLLDALASLAGLAVGTLMAASANEMIRRITPAAFARTRSAQAKATR